LAEIVQQKGYYSFGMEISQFSAGTGTSKNWYNGKEIQDDFGLYWYDYGARFYDPMLGRWHTIDPLAEVSRRWSPYSYAFDNPMRFIDPDGQFPIETIWDIGNVIYDVGSAIYNHAKGDHKAARSNWGDAGMDAGAMLIPYVPAGASKIIKGGAVAAKNVDKVTDMVKASDKVTDVTKAGDGIIYKRTNPKTGKEYIGQAKGDDQFIKRQSSHDKAKGVKHDYEVVDRGEPGMDLDIKEETHIRQNGGPNNKSSNGTLENKRHQMNNERYKNAGGTSEKNY
jgi:RHS repeat-associated protein